MARGRIVSPEFWTDSKMITLSVTARLFYIGTWNFASCDQGHLPDDPLALKLKILPAEQLDAGELVTELLNAGRLVRRSVGDHSFLQIPTFARHQSASADKRWKSRCTACQLLETPQSLSEFSSSLSHSGELNVEGEGEAKRGGVEGRAPIDAAPSPTCTKHRNGTDEPCGPCGTARRLYDSWLQQKAATPTPPRGNSDPMCKKHEGYVDNPPIAPCEACRREKEAENAA